MVTTRSDAPIAVHARSSADDSSAMTLFGDGRDELLRDTLGLTISIARRERRAELDKALADRVEPQLRKLAALELEVAELRGAIAMLTGKEPPPPAKFPAVKAWEEGSVSYAGDVVVFAGGTYQAQCDTAQAPGSQDWRCLASAGASLTVRGTHDDSEEYRHLDVVMVNGSSFVALKDGPGPCPGSGWHLLASRGSRGNRGERGLTGMRGERGEPAATVISWAVDRRHYRAVPLMSDGKPGPAIDLRSLFEQYQSETRSADD